MLNPIPDEVRRLLAVAVAFLRPDGVLLDANEGFVRLICSDGSRMLRETVADTFIQPRFAELMAMPVAADGTIYEGHVTIGPYSGINSSLKARVSLHDGAVVFFGEYDIEEMESLQRSMLDLNAALTESQRQLARANRSLEQKASDYASIIETSIDGFARLDEQGRFLEVNSALCAMTGHRRETLLKLSLADIDSELAGMPPAALGATLTQAALAGRSERSWRRVDETLIATEIGVSQTPVRRDEFFAFVRDTTVRNEALRRLRRSEMQLRQVADNSSDMISLHDASGRYLYASQASQRLFGYSEEDLRGRPVRDFIHPDDLASLRTATGQAFAGSEQVVHRCRVRCASGRYVWVESIFRAVPNERRQVTELIVTTRDIDRRRRQEVQEEMQRTVLEMLAGGSALADIVHTIVSAVDRQGEDMPCCVLCLDAPEKSLGVAAAAGVGDAFAEALAAGASADETAGAGAAAWRGETVRVENLDAAAGGLPFAAAARAEGLCAAWVLPLKSLDGSLLGAFAVFRRHPGFFSEDGDVVHSAARLAAQAIEHRHTQADLQLAASVYRAIGEAVMVSDADNRISIVNSAFTRTTGYRPEEVIGRDPKMLSSGRHDPIFYQQMWATLSLTGRWQGQIWNRRKNGEEYPEWLTISTIHDERGAVLRRVALFSDITDQKVAEETIWRQANYDPLTQLPNRRLFRDRLQQEMQKTLRANGTLALLFLDLDRFKEVNDTLGHDVGDALLVEAAGRIRACVRATDTVARLGGDEFTVIMSGLSGGERVSAVAGALVQALAQPFPLGDEHVYVSVSVGITLFPVDGVDAETLIKQADQAMYVAKNAGRNRFSYFTSETQRAAQERLRLVRDMRAAIAGGGFEVFLQPIIDLASGRVVSAEALLRWKHPQRGWVFPGEFIPVAEDVGLIGEIGDFVFREAARLALAWREGWEEKDGEPPSIGVNLSPAQFADESLCTRWVEYLSELDLPGSALVIEVTEGLLLSDRPDTLDKLARLRAAGIGIAIDDFGTGYSALSYLKRFSVDFLKIALEFVREMASDPRDAALIEAIIVMAHKLGIKVIAEGVETQEQRCLLAAAGCDYAQGYLFARPAPAASFLAAQRPLQLR